MSESIENIGFNLKPELIKTCKVIVLARHGEVAVEPTDLVYNRDVHMKPEDIVHISREGEEKMRDLGELILQNGFDSVLLWVSPEIRAQESAQALNRVLNIGRVEMREEVDEIDSPNGYLAGVTMEEHRTIAEDLARLAEIEKLYPAEDQYHVADRMEVAFRDMAGRLKIGETGIILSHGHPLAFLTHKLLYPDREIPSGNELYKTELYCPKGNALAVIMDVADSIVNLNFLIERDKSKIY